MDNEHIDVIKRIFNGPKVDDSNKDKVLSTIREVMETKHKTFMYHLPMPTKEDVYVRYPLEDKDGGALLAAHKKYQKIMDIPPKTIPKNIRKEVSAKIPRILLQALNQ